MIKVLKSLLRKTFDLREGEEQRAFLMQLNIFLIISTLLVVKPSVNGLFLSKIGVESLPLAFILVALFAALLSSLYARFLGKATLNRILLTTLGVSVGLFVLFGFLLRGNRVEGWVLYSFYIWTAIFGVLTASQFWILANMVFNAREARRLFGFIGAGAIAGGVFGGYLTTLLAEWIGSENLPFVGAGLLFFCIPITNFIWNKNVLKVQTKFQRRKKIAKAERPFQLIRKSSHLTYLAGIIGVGVIVAKLVDYQFNAIASAKITDPDELTAFFGFWFSNFNVISLLVQLLLTRRIVGTLGVGSSLFFLPATILLGAVFVFFIPQLWAAIFIKMTDGSLKQSVNKAAVELLALPIPVEIKNQTKTFIDVVVDSIATGIGGVILIFLVNGLDLSSRFISLMIFALIGLWFFFVWKVRKAYLQSFKRNMQRALGSQKDDLDLKNESVVGDLKQVLESGSEEQILYVLKKLKNQPDERFLSSFQNLLVHPSDRVKEESVRNLYFLKTQNLSEVIRPFIQYPAQEVKIAAFDYLLAHSPEDSMVLIENYLQDADYKIRLAALVGLAEESRDNLVLKEKFELEKRLRALYDELSDISDLKRQNFYKIGLLKALGLAKTPNYFPMIEAFFKQEDIQVIRQAVLSAGDTLHAHFLPALIQFLGDPALADAARAALVKYGREIIAVLRTSIQSPEARPEIMRMIPSIVENFGDQSAVDLLFQLMENSDPETRLAALRSLNQLKIRHGYLHFYEKNVLPSLLGEVRLYQDTLSILYVQRHAVNRRQSLEKVAKIKAARFFLIQLLEKRLDASMERIFRLLGLKYPPEDVISIYEGVQSPQPDLRANALEYLDNLLDSGLKKVLIPIVETALLEAISEDTVRALKLKIPDERECYGLLLKSEDEEVKAAARELVDGLGIL